MKKKNQTIPEYPNISKLNTTNRKDRSKINASHEHISDRSFAFHGTGIPIQTMFMCPNLILVD